MSHLKALTEKAVLKGGSVRHREQSWAEAVLMWFLYFKNETVVLSVGIDS